jgi:menaquinol-cytochrome c reductase iron-sulfur subunit
MSRLVNRRGFMGGTIALLAGAAAAVVTVPILTYLLQPLFAETEEVWRDIGGIDDFPVGETVQANFEEPSPAQWAGQTATSSAWVRRSSATELVAFAVNCTHLGCPITWVPGAQLFLCPCHGGVFYADGTVAGGPPERELFQYPVRVEDGRVLLQPRGLQIGDIG